MATQVARRVGRAETAARDEPGLGTGDPRFDAEPPGAPAGPEGAAPIAGDEAAADGDGPGVSAVDGEPAGVFDAGTGPV